ncbi:MAG: hypothetical protein JXQ82_07290 [Methanomicrobiaceae archaeon]|nr:hypothetical protein [Methanomicrobiaceae archaeon]
MKTSETAFFAALFILVIFLSVSGCTEKTKNTEETNLTIISHNTCWSPAMSSIIGIDMTPEYKGYGDCIFHWTATGVSAPDVNLLLWGAETTGEITDEGNDTWTEPGTTLLWSYRNFEIETMPEKFTLNIEAVDRKTNETLAETEVKISRKTMVFCIEST